MDDDIKAITTTQQQPALLDKEGILASIINSEQLQAVLAKILEDLSSDRETAIEDHDMLKDMIANETDPDRDPTTSIEQLAALLQIALDATDKRLRLIDILLRAMGNHGGSGGGSGNAQQTNIYLGDRRELLKDIEAQITAKRGGKTEKGES